MYTNLSGTRPENEGKTENKCAAADDQNDSQMILVRPDRLWELESGELLHHTSLGLETHQ